MPDEVASESGVGANDLKKPETSKLPWGFLRNFGGRFKKHEVAHQQEDQPKRLSFEEVWATFPPVEKLKSVGTKQKVYKNDWTKEYEGYPLEVLWEIMKQRMDVNDRARFSLIKQLKPPVF